MPFIPKQDREQFTSENDDVDLLTAVTPGEKCYVAYRKMIQEWRKNPRWATADQLLAPLIPGDYRRAAVLAYMVFFMLHVMPYEVRKRRENGEVEE